MLPLGVGEGPQVPSLTRGELRSPLLHRAANTYNSVVNQQIKQVSKKHGQERGREGMTIGRNRGQESSW